jgi:hypothetical protein
VSKWKKHGKVEDKAQAKMIKKLLRAKVNDDRRNTVRKHIKPGNKKSLCFGMQ